MWTSYNFFLALIVAILKDWSCIGLPSSNSPQNAQMGATEQSESILDLVMPSVRPTKPDEYLCTAVKLANVEQFVTSYAALAKASRAHHILIYGCEQIVTNRPYWHCGAMCSNGSPRILFAWAKNAPATKMPNDVAFRVGPGTGAQYLVLQIHYNSPLQANDPDDKSGVELTLTRQPPKYLAGILLFVAYDIKIPAQQSKVHTDITCQYPGRTILYPFAFRVHAHSLGKVISAYHNNGTWQLIGKGNPQWPQAFYPIEEKISIRPNENLAARCTYDASERNRMTHIGGTHNDEMCNFYMMYYTDFARGPSFLECAGNQIPNLISQLPPGSDTPLPPNPMLEEVAAGHFHGGMPGKDAPRPDPASDASQPNPQPINPTGELSSQNTGYGNGFIETVPNWPTIVESDHVKLGQVAGVAVDSHDNLFVFHRGRNVWDDKTFTADNKFSKANEGAIPENVILQFDQLGDLKDQWGKNSFFLPHGIHIDEDDNIWMTDVAMHQVFMYKKGSKTPSLTLGTRMVPGSDTKHFCKPTDVTTTKSGFVFISDGYCNARIMKFKKDGTFIKQWGTPTVPTAGSHNGIPKEGTFNLPHSITTLEDRGWVCVADRENGRIQCFDYNGKFIKNIHLEGFHSKLFAVAYNPKNKVLFAVNGATGLKSAPVQGFVVDPDSGNLITTFVPGNKVEFGMPHDIAINNEGDQVYVCEITPSKIWDFKVDQGKLKAALYSAKYQSIRADSRATLSSSKANLDNLDDIPGDFGASIVIGLLLVVPIIIIVSITVFLRLKKKGRIPFLSNYKNRNRRFNLGNFFSRHNGFDRVKTEEGDELDHLNSDSDVEEYSATAQKA